MKFIKQTVAAAALVAASSASVAGPVLEFGEEGFLEINYSMQLWSQYRDFTSANHDGGGNDIFLRRNRITLMGQQSDIVGFYAQLEAGGDSRAGNDDKAVSYRDAYITLDFNDATRFILGRFKNTFTRENLEACLEPLTLDRADASYSPFGGTRDTGAVMWGNLGDTAAFQYRFMVADGREGDDVAKKMPRVTTRFHWSALDPEYDYGYRGTYLGTRRIFTLGASYDYQADVAYADYANLSDTKDYKAWTVDGFFEYPFKSGTYTVSAAYFNYGVGNAINKTPDSSLPLNTELEGFYVKAGYLFPQPVGVGRLQLFARHDGNDYNLTSGALNGALDRKINSVGANYYINGQRLKLTAEYQNVDFANPDASNPALQDYNQFTLGFQFIL